MSENLARAVARLVSTSPFMINISISVHLYALSIAMSPRRLSSSGAQQDRRKGNNIYTRTTYMCDILVASVVIRLLFIRCIKSTHNRSKLTAVVFSAGSSTTSNSDTMQYPQIRPPCLWWLFLAVFFPPKGPSLSPCPSLLLLKLCYQPLTSPPSLQKLRTDRVFFKFPTGSYESLQEKKA